jgi:hypothetical protein
MLNHHFVLTQKVLSQWNLSIYISSSVLVGYVLWSVPIQTFFWECKSYWFVKDSLDGGIDPTRNFLRMIKRGGGVCVYSFPDRDSNLRFQCSIVKCNRPRHHCNRCPVYLKSEKWSIVLRVNKLGQSFATSVDSQIYSYYWCWVKRRGRANLYCACSVHFITMFLPSSSINTERLWRSPELLCNSNRGLFRRG